MYMEEHDYKFWVALGLFSFSEGLAFLKKVKPSGILHFIYCFLKGSDCVVKTAIKGTERALEYEEKDPV